MGRFEKKNKSGLRGRREEKRPKSAKLKGFQAGEVVRLNIDADDRTRKYLNLLTFAFVVQIFTVLIIFGWMIPSFRGYDRLLMASSENSKFTSFLENFIFLLPFSICSFVIYGRAGMLKNAASTIWKVTKYITFDLFNNLLWWIGWVFWLVPGIGVLIDVFLNIFGFLFSLILTPFVFLVILCAYCSLPFVVMVKRVTNERKWDYVFDVLNVDEDRGVYIDDDSLEMTYYTIGSNKEMSCSIGDLKEIWDSKDANPVQVEKVPSKSSRNSKTDESSINPKIAKYMNASVYVNGMKEQFSDADDKADYITEIIESGCYKAQVKKDADGQILKVNFIEVADEFGEF